MPMPDVADLKLHGDEDTDDAISAFMTQWSKDPDASKKPSEDEGEQKEKTPAEGETEPEPKTDEDAEKPSDEDEGEEQGEEEADEEEGEPKRKYSDDETYVKVKVGDDEHEVPVKNLTRLYGQEAALTRKSQEVAEARRTADEAQAKAMTATNVMLQRATERANQYRALDFFAIAKELSPEEMNTLRANATAAFEEEKFFKEELDGFVKTVAAKQAEVAKTEAQDCIKQLTDPTSPVYIEGWNEKLYNDLRTFAVDQGVPVQFVNALRVPGAFKLLHMAMQYASGQKALIKVTKVKDKKPTKIIKPSTAPRRKTTDSTKKDAAMAKLKATGTQEDAANAFLARAGVTD